MFSIFNFLKSPFYWAMAIKRIHEGNNLDAYISLNKLHEKFTKNNYKYYLLKGFVLLMLKEYEHSIKVLDYGLIAVNKNNLNNDEKRYLQKYIYSLIEMSYKMMDQTNNAEKTRIEMKKISYSIDNIQERIIQLFPQRNTN